MAFEMLNPMDSFLRGRAQAGQEQTQAIQNATGQVGLLTHLQQLQQQQQLRDVLASDLAPEQKQAALMKTPAGLGILKQMQDMEHSRQQAELYKAQIGNFGRLADVEQRKQSIEDQKGAAVSALANAYTPSTYDRPGLTPVSRVLPAITPNVDQTPEDAAAIAAFKAQGVTNAPDTGPPLSMVAPNKEAIQSLAIQADPKAAIAAILKAQNPAGFAVGSTKVVPGGYLEMTAEGPKFVETRKDSAAATAGGIGAGNEETLTPSGEKVKNDLIRSGLTIPKTRRGQIDNAALNSLGRENDAGKPAVSSSRADYRSASAALTQNSKDLAAIRPYNDMLEKNANIAMDLADKVIATDVRFANKSLNWLRQNAGDNPDAAEFLAQTQIVSTEAARVLNNPRLVGQLTDSARHEMQGIINGDMPVNAYKRVLQRMQSDGRNRVSAMVKEHDFLSRLLGGDAAATVAVPTAAVTGPKVPTFATEAEAAKANLEDGQEVIINGRKAKYRK